MTDEAPKTCITCKHSLRGMIDPKILFCLESPHTEGDGTLAAVMRQFGQPCGPDGKLWEPSSG